MAQLDISTVFFKPISQRQLQNEKNIKAGYALLDFTVAQTVNVDFTVPEQQNNISAILGIFFDNSGNNSPVSIRVGSAGQVLQLPGGYQGYLPLLSMVPDIFVASSVGGVVVPITFLNFRPDPCVWPAVGIPGTTPSSPNYVRDITRNSITFSNVVPGASTNVAAANVNRNGLVLQAATANATSAWINFGSAAAANQYIELPPGGNFTMQEPGNVDTRDCFLFGTGGNVTVGVY